MKYQILIDMLFKLLTGRRTTIGELAAKYEVSPRTIHRYLDEMTVAGIPIDTTRGAAGGVYISEAFTLPRGFLTQEEYTRAINAMLAMREQTGDTVLSAAIEKLSAQRKKERKAEISGSILVDGGAWGDERKFSDKIAFLERAIEEHDALEIEYVDRGGESSRRVILPHLLILKQNIWYVYAHCRLRGTFRTFRVGRIRTLIKTGETFTPIPFRREDVPLTFWKNDKQVDALFSIQPAALPFAVEWLGIENVIEHEGKYFAEITLPDDETLVGKILSMGKGFKVVKPESLKERVREEARRILEE